MVCGDGTAPGWLGWLRRGMGMILVTGKSVVVVGWSAGVGIYSPSPLRLHVSKSRGLPSNSAPSTPSLPDVHHPLSSLLAMIGGGGVINVQRLTSVKLD